MLLVLYPNKFSRFSSVHQIVYKCVCCPIRFVSPLPYVKVKLSCQRLTGVWLNGDLAPLVFLQKYDPSLILAAWKLFFVTDTCARIILDFVYF
jgi:hypothetical protein